MSSTIDVFGERLKSVKAHLDEWQVDALLVGSTSNRRWLSGFTGSAGWLLISADTALLATDFRYWDQARRQAPSYELFAIKGHRAKAILDLATAVNASRIGIESEFITLEQFDMMRAVPDVSWIELSGAIRPLREVKSAEEISAIRAAAAITDQVMAQVPYLARPGTTEKELAWELEKQMREAGASDMAFPVIVASGPNGALPHHRPTDRSFQAGDGIIVDMGAKLDGYCSDMTRSFYMGAEPDGQYREIYHVVQQAQTAALDRLKAGMKGKDVDSFARSVIDSAGYGEAFGHSLGHGVGLDVHESPRLSHLAEEGIIPNGSVVTIEPGIYLPGWGGVRIEDLALITDSGIDLISACPKKPFIPIGDH